jgi:hypothetical protein
MSVKFPKEPSISEQQTYLDFINNFSKLYPCGDCASHFQMLLRKHPPLVKSRDDVVGWTCMVHNIVNERLGKMQYDCSKVMENYSCGCEE